MSEQNLALNQPLLAENGPPTSEIARGESNTQGAPKKVHSRLLSLDLFRGLIICIMAWLVIAKSSPKFALVLTETCCNIGTTHAIHS